MAPPNSHDIVGEASKCGSRELDLLFAVQYLRDNCIAVRAGSITSRVRVFRVRATRNKHMVPYYM